MSESGSFEQDLASDGSYLTSPSAKRPRFEDPSDVDEVAQVTEVETVEEEPVPIDHTVTITVPSSQFEIEINSQNESGSPTEIGHIQSGDLAGPAFGIVHETQEIALTEPQLTAEGAIAGEDGGTLNAIGRALIQIQQQNNQSIAAAAAAVSGVATAGGIPQSQLIFTRGTSTDSEPPASNANGNTPLYVMIPPASSAEILQAMGQSRPIAPKSNAVATADLSNTDVATAESLRINREAQRKATHNEVERRRRDRINELIKVLAQVVPGCQKKDATTGNIVGYVYSKGTVLDKTVEYLKDLMTQNEQLAAAAKLAEKSAGALSVLQNQIAVLEKENAFLRAQIIQFGIDAAASSGSQSSAGSRQLLNSPLAQSLLSSVSQSPQVASAINMNNTAVTSTPSVVSSSPPVAQGAQSSTQLAAQQLLISLAQSLTNSPLLTSQSPSTSSSPLTQPPITTSPSSAHLAAAVSQLSAVPTVTPVTPSRLTTPPSQQLAAVTVPSTPPAPQPPPPQQQQLAQSPSLFNTGAATVSLSSSAPMFGSLVQTLASLAGTNTTASPSPLPKTGLSSAGSTIPAAPPAQSPAGGGLSAAAAASLLNTLILAQSVLTGGGGGAGGVVNPAVSGQGGGSLLGDSSSVLSGIGLESVAAGDHTTQ